MARPLGATNEARVEFFIKFDKLARDHVDPLRLMFEISKGRTSANVEAGIKSEKWEKHLRFQAARELVSYRYPKLKATEQSIDVGDGQLTINWITDDLDTDNEQEDNDQLPSVQLSITNTQ